MLQPLRIGFIGLDTSHVIHFTRLLNCVSDANHVAGGRVVVAYPGGSPDFETSWSRVEDYTHQLQNDYGVEIVDSPEAVAEQIDLLFIESVDGRVHFDQFERTLPYRRPTFIDKPIALCSHEAKRIKLLAEREEIVVMSSSALRFAENLTLTINAAQDKGEVVGCDVYGPMVEEPTQPGLFWYGIHSVEVLFTVMGQGCRSVTALKNEDTDLIVAEWTDGRIGTIRGSRREHFQFGVTIHCEGGPLHTDLTANDRPFYASLLESIMQHLPFGHSPIPIDETLEIVRLIEAANESRSSMRQVEIVS